MTYRALRTIFLSALFILLMFLSGVNARNYVILSMTEDGLRELRLSFRGRMILETSLASVQSADRLALNRATDGIRMVETVIRYGAIDDCIVSSAYEDVVAFSSEFSGVPSGKLLVPEEDVMDVYLGIKNITDSVFLQRHSKIDSRTTLNSSTSTIVVEDVLQERSSSRTDTSSFIPVPRFKLSAKISSLKNSSFLHMLKPYLQIRKKVRECRNFHEKATQILESLWILDQQVHLEGPSGNLIRTSIDNQTLHRLHPHRQHRLHHHSHHRLGHQLGRNITIKDLEEADQREIRHSRYHAYSSPSNDTEEIGHIRNSVPATNLGSNSETLDTGRSENESASETSRFPPPFSLNSSSLLSSTPLTVVMNRIPGSAKTTEPYRTLDSTFSQNGSNSVFEVKETNRSYQNGVYNNQSGAYNNQTWAYNNQSGTYNNQSGVYNNQSGTYNNQSAVYNNQSGTYNNQSAVYNNQSIQITGSEETLSIGSPESHDSHTRSKRDLLTGWMIFPGTKWCGDGDIAENKKDMGYHVELDKCCRRHDLCPLVIPRLSWKYGMFNYRLHTLSHCRCDRKFRKCLKASTSPLAHLIGQIYFNVVGPHCFKFTQKPTCVQRFWWGGCREWASSKVAVSKKQRRFK